MLFLMGIYRGVSEGSLEYIRASDADLWVLQEHANNIIRSTSLVRTSNQKKLEEIEGVKSASPLVLILGSIRSKAGEKTVYLAGYDPDNKIGGPPEILKGRGIESEREIVLDRSFSDKNGLEIGDTIFLKKDTLILVGLSTKTNMIVTQYAFITLEQAYRYLGFRGIASCYILKLSPNFHLDQVKNEIESKIEDVMVFDRDTFLINNTREMESGLLPLLFLVAMTGAIVLTTILSLILSINVLENRRDHAIMKALGAPYSYNLRQLLFQSMILAVSGLFLAIILVRPMTMLIENLAPEVLLRTSFTHMGIAAVGILIISLISTLLPAQKLRKVYPLELFQ
jgi:ABC-type antimicrobial peptide transport system permease subunit